MQPRRRPLGLEQMVAQHARESPGDAAIDDGRVVLTYQDLWSATADLAEELVDSGVGPGDIVAIKGDASPGYVVAALAVMRSGGCWLPVGAEDAAIYNERLFDLTRPKAVLEGTEVLEGVARRKSYPRSDMPRLSSLGPEAVVALFPTSGTTGMPKLAEITRRGLANLSQSLSKRLGIKSADRVLVTAGPTFSAFLEEALAPIGTGASVLLGVRHDELLSAQRLFETARSRDVTVTEIITPLWEEIGAQLARNRCELPPALRLILVGGERAGDASIRAWSRISCGIAHVYGAAETTATVSYYGPTQLTRRDCRGGRGLSLGEPILNTEWSVRSDDGQILDLGDTGELYVSGDSLARGYFGDSQSTAKNFVTDTTMPNALKWYRTGDVVEVSHAGELFFVGRSDRQAKVSGHRVDLTEIERTAEACVGVRRVIARIEDREPIGPTVVCHVYMEARTDGERLSATLQDYLRARLRGPAGNARLEMHTGLPTTREGKIDGSRIARVVSSPGTERRHDGESGAESAVHLDDRGLAAELERMGLCGISGSDALVFNRRVSSLGRMRLASRLTERFNVPCDAQMLVDNPTIHELRHRMEVAGSQRDRTGGEPSGDTMTHLAECSDFPLSPNQEAIWAAEELFPGRDLVTDELVLPLFGGLGDAAVCRAFGVVLSRNAALRTRVSLSTEGLRQRWTAEYAVPAVTRCSPLDFQDPDALKDTIYESAGEAFGAPMSTEDRSPIRALLLRDDDQRRALVLKIHHIQFDAWSRDIVVRDLLAACNGPSAAAGDRASYREYVSWLAGSQITADDGAVRELRNLLATRSRSARGLGTIRQAHDATDRLDANPKANHAWFALDEPTLRAVSRLADSLGVDPATVLLSLWGAIVKERFGAETLEIAFANRGNPRFANTVGLFANILPAIVRFDDTDRLSRYVEATARTVVVLRNVAWASSEVLVESQLIQYRSPFMFSYEDCEMGDWNSLTSGDLYVAAPIDLPGTAIATGAALTLRNEGRSIRGSLEWQQDFLSNADATWVIEAFGRLVVAAVTSDSDPLVAELVASCFV